MNALASQVAPLALLAQIAPLATLAAPAPPLPPGEHRYRNGLRSDELFYLHDTAICLRGATTAEVWAAPQPGN